MDFDTRRIRTGGARHLQVEFDYQADSFDNAMGWSTADFAFFNGTNVLLYPEGRGFSFPATVRITTEPDWRVATGMHPAAAGGYTEKNYHDLVDMPFFVGAFDYDSAMVGSLNVRLATYPAGWLSGAAREAFWADYRRMFAPQAAVFGETPYDNYAKVSMNPLAALAATSTVPPSVQLTAHWAVHQQAMFQYASRSIASQHRCPRRLELRV